MVRRAAAIVAHAVSLMQAFDIRAPHPGVPGRQSLRRESAEDGHRARVLDPLTLLLAAQPTRGLDIAATAFIHQHLVQQRDQGCAVVLVSADLDELLTLADRIAVMYDGKILAIVADHEASRETLGPLMAGVPMP